MIELSDAKGECSDDPLHHWPVNAARSWLEKSYNLGEDRYPPLGMIHTHFPFTSTGFFSRRTGCNPKEKAQ